LTSELIIYFNYIRIVKYMNNINVCRRLCKLLSKRGWIIIKIIGKMLIAQKRNYFVIFITKEGDVRVFVDKYVIKKAMRMRDRLRNEGKKVDVVIAARIGRKWHFLLITKVKSIKLIKKSTSNWRP